MALNKTFFPTDSDIVHNSLIDVITALGVVRRSLDLKRGPRVYIPGIFANFEVIVEAGNGPALETVTQPLEVLGTFEVTEFNDADQR